MTICQVNYYRRVILIIHIILIGTLAHYLLLPHGFNGFHFNGPARG